MKIKLLLPPAGQKTPECFLLPTLSLPVLAGHLRANGLQVQQQDLEILFQAKLAGEWDRADFKVLENSRVITDYLNGRLPAGEAAAVERIETRLFSLAGPGKADVFGISLVNLKTVFHINSAALLANRIKKLYSAPVVIGNKTISSSIYTDILARYPVFDYAVYAQMGGEEPLLQLIRRLGGDKSARLSGTLERLRGGRLKDHPDTDTAPGKCTIPDYGGYPLDRYALTGEQILSRYSCDYPVFRDILAKHGGKRQLIAMTRFESTCRANCVFCNNRPTLDFSDRRSTAEILEDLENLKAAGATDIYFLNSQFNNRYREAEELCDGMIKRKLGLRWCDCVNCREMDEKLLTKMRDAGAVKLTFGMETGSPRMMKYIRKGTTVDKVRRLLDFSHSLGLWNNIELIGGLPTEKEADIRATTAFIRSNSDIIDAYSLNPFYLARISPLYCQPERHGITLRPPVGPQDYISAEDKVCRHIDKFDEIGGLSWEEKDDQIRASTRRIADTIISVAPPVNIEGYHINLLMYLYGIFGHARKGLIRKLMRVATARFKPYYQDTFIVPEFQIRGKAG